MRSITEGWLVSLWLHHVGSLCEFMIRKSVHSNNQSSNTLAHVEGVFPSINHSVECVLKSSTITMGVRSLAS